MKMEYNNKWRKEKIAKSPKLTINLFSQQFFGISFFFFFKNKLLLKGFFFFSFDSGKLEKKFRNDL